MRSPVVAGRFYTADKEQLKIQVDGFLDNHIESDVIPWGIISPHAGFMFSGKTAGIAHSRLATHENIKRVVLLCPSHTGAGEATEVSSDEWSTPFGILRPDLEAIDILRDKGMNIGEEAHFYEHSIEVQLPFLQRAIDNSFNIIPICLRDYSYKASKNIAKILSEMEDLLQGDTVYVASSDFSHYLSPEIIKKIDSSAIDLILKGDGEVFFDYVIQNDLSICGFLPITVMLCLNRLKGDSKINLLDYSHSGEVSPSNEVVGYAAIEFGKII